MHVLVLSLFLLLTVVKTTSTLWTYPVTWPEGEVTSYTYPRTAHGDCLYDPRRDRLICMRNHGYQSVVSTWLYDPELILYVSVRCLSPHPYPHHLSPLAPTCVCKGQQHVVSTDAVLRTADPSPLTAEESFHRCQLEDVSPSMLAELDQLEVLDLSHNLLRHLSPSIFLTLRSLKVLSLGYNPLEDLPVGLVCPLSSLEVLDLRGAEVTSFPGHAFRCDVNDSLTSSVRWLDLSGNHISEMAPGSLWYLPRVSFLNVSDNHLHHLPPHPLLGAPSLSTLLLDRNLLHDIPESFCEGAGELQRLSLRSNSFSSLTLASLDTCHNLTRLDLTGNALSSLPGPPASLGRLLHLDLARNRLTTLNSPLVTPGNCSMVSVDLSYNALRSVSPAVLDGMPSLVFLDLHGNSLGENFDLSRSFLNLTSLKVLDLSDNWIESVREDDFDGLSSLITLDLSHNRIRDVFVAVDTSLTRVTHLNLSYNYLTSLEARAVLPLESLRVLDLSGNLLKRVPALHTPASLLSLDLKENSLVNVPQLSGAGGLKTLDLSRNSVSQVERDDLQGLSSLRKLNMAHNSLSLIHPEAFSPLRHLRKLQLSYNSLTLNDSVSAMLFSGLHELQLLNLSHNLLDDVTALFQPDTLTSVLDLDVSHNVFTTITHRFNQHNLTMHLQHLHVEGCRLSHVSRNAFRDLIYLRSVNLQHNLLTHLPLFRTHPGVKYRLHGNPITCDCHAGWLTLDAVRVEGLLVPTHDYDLSACRVYPRGHLRSISEVRRREFLCRVPECSSNCTCYGREEGGATDVMFCTGGVTAVPPNVPSTVRVLSLEGGWLGDVDGFNEDEEEGEGWSGGPLAMEELYLNDSGITDLSPSAFQRTPSLSILRLERNHLRFLPSGVFSGLYNLTDLSLRENSLADFPARLMYDCTALRDLDLSHNDLTTLDTDTVAEMTRLPHLHRVSLSGNPWRCHCHNAQLYRWLRSNVSRVTDHDGMYCDDDPSQRFLEADETLFDCSDDGGGGLPTAAVAVLLVVVSAVVAVAALVYKFRRVIAAVLYARLGVQCWAPRSDHHDVSLGCVYDVSLLFDHSDRKCRWWVEQILLPHLTSPSWRLRVHVPRASGSSQHSVATLTSGGRGESMVESVVHGVRQSAVCLVLLSKNFGSHQHTVTSLGHVLQQAQARSSSLVLVTWGELTKQTLESGVRPYLGGPQHLPITATFFWDRLFFLLPSPHPHSGADRHRRRRSLIAACRFRSLSDVSATPVGDEAESQCTQVSHDV